MTENEQKEQIAAVIIAGRILKHSPELVAEDLMELGYRKLERGEWEKSPIPGEDYNCSVCGGVSWVYDDLGYVCKSNFCPNCGADMRGNENEKK